jgi:proteasome-associated ATPase
MLNPNSTLRSLWLRTQGRGTEEGTMHRNATIDIQTAMHMQLLQSTGEGAPSIEEKQGMLAEIRNRSADASDHIDRHLLGQLEKLASGLQEAKNSQKELHSIIDNLTAPPWHPAILLGLEETAFGKAALVLHGGIRRIVNISGDIDSASLVVGDEVLLGSKLNVIMARSPYSSPASGQTAVFERYTPDRRLVLKVRDEELIVYPSGSLSEVELHNGDEIRYDSAAWLAFERIERSKGEHLFLEETPQETFEDIGGLGPQVNELQRSILLHFYHRDIVMRYHSQRKKAVLLFGPAGTGKTLMAKALANWLAQLSKSGNSRFINVKPASLNSMWYGESEANYRKIFQLAREAGEREPEVPVVIFFDEVDAVAATRGGSIHRIDDRVLNAFMAELNGLEDRGNIMIVSATNRLDSLDPAVTRTGRLGDLVLKIPRPNRTAARDIFCKHLRSDIPYASNGHDPAVARELIIQSAISRIYSPNGDGELATITFRDGKTRAVHARDLINGAEIAKIARTAIESACLREAENGPGGVTLEDMLSGISGYLETATQGLTPANCRHYLDDLPQDTDVVRVDSAQRRVRRPHEYLNSPR